MIVSRAFAENARGVRFGTEDNAPLFSRIVASVEPARETIFACRIFDRMVDFMSETERRALPSAAGRAHGAMRIPRNRIGVRIEVVVVARICGQGEVPSARMFEPREERAFTRIRANVGFRAIVGAFGAGGDGERSMPYHRAIVHARAASGLVSRSHYAASRRRAHPDRVRARGASREARSARGPSPRLRSTFPCARR